MTTLLLGVLGCSLVLSAHALYSSSDDVLELTASNFNKEVLDSDSLCLVEFYAPWCGHCKNLAGDWKKVATALKGSIKVAALDADQHGSLASQYGIQGFPTIKIFAGNKKNPEEYRGGRTVQAIVEAALNAQREMIKDRMSGKSGSFNSKNQRSGGGGGGSGNKEDVVKLTESNFDSMVLESDATWMVEFYAPWCGHCKRLEPEWAAAATEVKGFSKGKVRLGAVDATEHKELAGKYEIRGYPTIKIFQKGENPENYNGGRNQESIVAKARDLLAENAPPPEVKEILSEEIVKSTCEDSQLCIVAVLPHILDSMASGRNEYLEVMKKMAEKYKRKMWGWLWTEAGAQMDLETSLGIGGFGYPAMAAVNSRKMKYALLRGSFSETGIHEFLRELSVGRGQTATWGNGAQPKIHNVEAWDGKDGQLPEEEDLDLSDVDMSEDFNWRGGEL